jgi:quinol monooxygenase YgiN
LIYVVATLNVKPEMRAELLDAATACIAATRKEPGCISYDSHESVTDPGKLVFVEQWESKEALDAHFKTSHFRTLADVIQGRVTAPLKVEVITPAKVEVL